MEAQSMQQPSCPRVQEVCPLLLPTNLCRTAYDGYISCGGEDYRLSVTLPPTGELKDARLDCDWRLRILLRGYEDAVQRRLEQSRELGSFLLELQNILGRLQRVQRKFESPRPPSFYSQLVQDLDSLGWERVVHIDPTFTNLSIRTRDGQGREHVLSIHLSPQHPTTAPVCSADLPVAFQPHWTPKSSLVDLLRQFEADLARFEPFWLTVEELDQRLCILEPERPSRACTYRRIVIGGCGASLQLTIDPLRPQMLPECRFMGPDSEIGPLRQTLSSKASHWDTGMSVLDNLKQLLEIEFPSPTARHKEVIGSLFWLLDSGWSMSSLPPSLPPSLPRSSLWSVASATPTDWRGQCLKLFVTTRHADSPSIGYAFLSG